MPTILRTVPPQEVWAEGQIKPELAVRVTRPCKQLKHSTQERLPQLHYSGCMTQHTDSTERTFIIEFLWEVSTHEIYCKLDLHRKSHGFFPFRMSTYSMVRGTLQNYAHFCWSFQTSTYLMVIRIASRLRPLWLIITDILMASVASAPFFTHSNGWSCLAPFVNPLTRLPHFGWSFRLFWVAPHPFVTLLHSNSCLKATPPHL